MKLAGILLIALAATGCVKQEQIRTRSMPDLYRLCTDGRNQDMCTAVPEAEPIRVDTNFASPPRTNRPGLG